LAALKASLVEETCELLTKLIQNKCVNPPGNEMRSIKTIEQFLGDRGINSQVFESAPNRGNLVAKIEGTGQGPNLMFGPSHVDVVPVDNPNDWQANPFGGEIIDEHVYGRGSFDMLFIVATQLQAFVKLHEENFEPKGDLILLCVADEEAGGVFGTEWVVKNHWDAIGQPTYAVTEAGGFSLAPGKFIFMIGEKGANWKRISFKGTPGHGSMPYKSDNAVQKAALAITRLTAYSDSKLPRDTRYLDYLAKGLEKGFFSRLFLRKKRLLPITLKMIQRKDKQMVKVIHSLSQMTMSPNIVEGGLKTNTIPAQATIEVDIRTLPGQDEEYVMTHLRKALGPLAKEATITQKPPEEGGFLSYGNASPAASEFVGIMEKTVQQEFPEAKLIPFMVMGGTDARFLREKGVEAYGFSLADPQTPLSDLTDLMHGTNERVSIKTVELSLKAYYNLAKNTLD
jgi:acetylornithine deacetylase/succinyl-diaminopimelate desuccinylase-like protein